MPTSKSSTSSDGVRCRHFHELAANEDYRALLCELLARIHRDGGQYTQLAGFAVSFEDADLKVAELHNELAELRYRLKRLEDG